jgi:hypothetical protein
MSGKKGKSGGVRRGAGRPFGSVNSFTLKQREALAKTGKMPHELMLEVARAKIGDVLEGWGPVDKADRMWALAQSANYFAPKLAATEHTGKVLVFALPAEALVGCSDEELALAEKLLTRLQAGQSGAAPLELTASAYNPDA